MLCFVWLLALRLEVAGSTLHPMRPRPAVLLISGSQNPTFLESAANPFPCHTSEKSPVTLIIATLPKTPSRKPCVCHTYETPQGWYASLLNTYEQRGQGGSHLHTLVLRTSDASLPGPRAESLPVQLSTVLFRSPLLHPACPKSPIPFMY